MKMRNGVITAAALAFLFGLGCTSTPKNEASSTGMNQRRAIASSKSTLGSAIVFNKEVKFKNYSDFDSFPVIHAQKGNVRHIDANGIGVKVRGWVYGFGGINGHKTFCRLIIGNVGSKLSTNYLQVAKSPDDDGSSAEASIPAGTRILIESDSDTENLAPKNGRTITLKSGKAAADTPAEYSFLGFSRNQLFQNIIPQDEVLCSVCDSAVFKKETDCSADVSDDAVREAFGDSISFEQ